MKMRVRKDIMNMTEKVLQTYRGNLDDVSQVRFLTLADAVPASFNGIS
jgi:hypothetical protein